MSMRTFFSMAVVLMATPAAARQAQQLAAAEPQPASLKKMCRSVMATGSIMPKRICLTRSEWARFNSENEKHVELARDKAGRAVEPGLDNDLR